VRFPLLGTFYLPQIAVYMPVGYLKPSKGANGTHFYGSMAGFSFVQKMKKNAKLYTSPFSNPALLGLELGPGSKLTH
jgi:hypothetical protein